MAVERTRILPAFYSGLRSERGQSLMELCLLLPAIVFISLLMVKVTIVIQMGIVNQQYARAQAHFLAWNSAVFPHIVLRTAQSMDKIYNQMIIGVQDNKAESGTTYPEASIYKIFWKTIGSDEAKKEPELRTRIRVRSTVTMCSQANFVGKNQEIMGYESLTVTKKNILGDDPKQFNFCGSPYL